MSDVLAEARKLIFKDRQDSYGKTVFFDKMSGVCKVLDIDITTPDGVALFMILVKFVRQTINDKQDNKIDLIGYTALLSIIKGDWEVEST